MTGGGMMPSTDGIKSAVGASLSMMASSCGSGGLSSMACAVGAGWGALGASSDGDAPSAVWVGVSGRFFARNSSIWDEITACSSADETESVVAGSAVGVGG